MEQGWPQPDSSQTKIISYIPFPQVCPVSLDTEDEVNQVKDVVMLLGLIRLSQAAGRSDHHWVLTTGRLLRTSAAPSIRSDERNIALSGQTSDQPVVSCFVSRLTSHLISRNSLDRRQLESFLSSGANISDCHLQHGSMAQVELQSSQGILYFTNMAQ